MRVGKLDQFYTNPEVARTCYQSAKSVLDKICPNPFYIEPSAGDGAFYDLLPEKSRIAFDIEPSHSEVIQQDFLQSSYRPPVDRSRVIAIGNPPFGKRGALAVDFINKAFTLADTVAFIVPVIFRKYFIHKQIVRGVNWVHRIDLDRNSFRTITGNSYAVNTEFQIWTRLPNLYSKKRLFTAPPIKHKDFTMYQYNNTKQALKMFNYPFEFAVPCQGYQDYTRRETDVRRCEKNKQWILFKPHNRQAQERLYDGIDYQVLAIKNTTTVPGFRKGDVVAEYAENYG